MAPLFRSLGLVGLGALASATDLKLSWTDCGDSSTAVKVTGLTPGTLTLGQETLLEGTGTSDAAISGGTYELTLTALGTKLLDHTGDICKNDTIPLPLSTGNIVWEGLSCPVAAGTVSLKMDVTLSANLPSLLDTTTIQLTGTSTSGGKILCVKIQTSKENLEFMTDPQWAAYKKQFSKQYASAQEEQERHGIFKQTLTRIDSLNRRNGETVFGLNPSSDRRPSEKWARGSRAPSIRPAPLLHTPNVRAPASIDWRLTPAVTPVKNQGQCGSCWAFSVAETVESTYILKTGQHYEVTLSPQQVASCTTACDGCGGGWTYDGYDYLKTVPGLASAWFWPYAQGLTPSGACSGPSCTQSCNTHNVSLLTPDQFYIGHYAPVSGYTYATPQCTGSCANQDLQKLAASVEKGPVSICVNAGAWDDYTGGVLSAAGCGGMASDDIDHCVQLVGYNTTAAKPYWIVRNSWDTVWGEDGYIYLEFDKNTCGLADVATVPTIDTIASAPEEFERMFQRAAQFSTGGSKIVV